MLNNFLADVTLNDNLKSIVDNLKVLMDSFWIYSATCS